ncbi:hypothetical protein LCGC14_2110440 [marine sediment metagenome]|uniref:Uncharacterized protein n=1 Tax=marine sediment metagenome TaxID=412755 RepID=A0A0F9E7C7_9ZZZZ
MATLDGNDLGNVQTESQNKDSSLFNQPLPGSDSSTSILLDLFGVTRTINLDGIKSGTAAALNTFITAIEALIGGGQSGVTFVSSLSTFANKTVFVSSFNWDYVKGDPNKISYSLSLTEGAAVA